MLIPQKYCVFVYVLWSLEPQVIAIRNALHPSRTNGLGGKNHSFECAFSKRTQVPETEPDGVQPHCGKDERRDDDRVNVCRSGVSWAKISQLWAPLYQMRRMNQPPSEGIMMAGLQRGASRLSQVRPEQWHSGAAALGLQGQGSPVTQPIVWAKSRQSCLTLWDPMDCSLPGSSVHGILQARLLEWVAMPSSRGSSWPRHRTRVSNISCIGRQVLYH